MLPKDELLAMFRDKKIDLKQPLVTMCGSGVTAAVLNLALDVAGVENVALYDGSWTDYASRKKSPIKQYV